MKNYLLLLLSTILPLFGFARHLAADNTTPAETRSTAGNPGERLTNRFKNAPSTSQSYVFNDNKSKVKVTLEQLNDSLTLKIEFTNQSTSPVYMDAEMPLSYRWTPAGNELMIEYGSDSNKQTEFPVSQIKGGETKDFLLKLPRKTSKFKMNLLVSYFESKSLAVQNVLLSTSNRKGSWNWAQYQVPILLKH